MSPMLRPGRGLLALLFALLFFKTGAQEDSFKIYDYGIERSTILKRQNPSFLATTGVHTGSGPGGSLPFRLEIRELQKNADAWTLYLLALEMMMNTDQSNRESWYQISGIHGRPYIAYDGVQATPGNQNNGYCTHVSILFPPWHRPYLALYEQILVGLAARIAQQYPAGAVRNRYAAAAANLRIPYWDWAAAPAQGQSTLPQSVQVQSVTVNGPRGTQTIKNPLFSYTFHPLDTKQLPNAPMNQWTETKRYPTTQNAAAQSQNGRVAQQLDNSAASFRDRLFNLFTNYHDYRTFSNEAYMQENGQAGFDSIESVHDQIHGLTGNGGHMTYIDYSAFDPLFFLHHAMVDRCFAIWRVLNPNSYVTPLPARYSTFTNSQGQVQNVSSPLTPFHSNVAGNFWTSDTARFTSTFGYVYPETSNQNGVNVRQQAVNAVNRLYGRPTKATVKLQTRNENAGFAANGTYTEWVANIRVEKLALGEPFFIHVFLGDFNPDSKSWSMERNLVGTHTIFTKASMGTGVAAEDCDCGEKHVVAATIPLTDAMMGKITKGELRSLKPQDAVNYVAKNIKYRITRLDDTEVPNADVPSLKISVASAEVQPPPNDNELPVWGPMMSHMNVGTC